MHIYKSFHLVLCPKCFYPQQCHARENLSHLPGEVQAETRSCLESTRSVPLGPTQGAAPPSGRVSEREFRAPSFSPQEVMFPPPDLPVDCFLMGPFLLTFSQPPGITSSN